MRLPGPHEFLARSLECDTARELTLKRTLLASMAQARGALRALQGRMADGVVTMAEARRTLEEISAVLAIQEAALQSAEISLRYNRIHNEVMGALRAGLDPRGAEAQARFPLLRLLDREGSIVRFPAPESEPEDLVA